MSYFGLLNKTCTIQRSTEAKDSVSAAITRSWSNAATLVRCAVQVNTSKERAEPLQAGEAMFDVFFAPGTDIRSKDRITTITGMSNVTLEVKTPPLDDAGRGKTLRVEALYVEDKATQ